MQAQPLGEVAREVMSENELWLAMALTHAALQVLRSALIIQTGPCALPQPPLGDTLACLASHADMFKEKCNALYEMHLAVSCALGNPNRRERPVRMTQGHAASGFLAPSEMHRRHFIAQNLAAPQLAGALAALVAGESVSRPSISAAYEPSQAVCNAIEALEDERERLYELQVQADIAATLSVDLRLSGGLIFSIHVCMETLFWCPPGISHHLYRWFMHNISSKSA